MLFRFHIYDFLHTTVEHAILTSPIFQLNKEMICLQLLIGLCAECDAQIVLRDYTNDEELIKVSVKGSSKSTVHGLPMWQSVTIRKNSSVTDYNSYSRVIIQLIPILNMHSSSPLWAIANVRLCPQIGTLRNGAIVLHQDRENSRKYFWSNVTCQKLFYDKNAVVNPISRIKSDINLDNLNCPQGKIGPQCLFFCAVDLNSDFECKGSKICYENGCTCAPGFLGDECLRPCDSNKYGYDCKKTCGSCVYASNEQCNKATGLCINGLCLNDNTRKIYIPPLCQTSVNKPNTPEIILVSETSFLAVVSMTWMDEYEGIPIFYSFVIQELLYKYGNQTWKQLCRNMTQLTEYFVNMEPGITYHIRFSLNVADVKIHSDWQVAETKCNPAENFDLMPEENSLIIDWRINPNQLYSCPTKWYYLLIFNIDTNEKIVSTLAPSFSYKLEHLSSYTFFDVTISHENRTLFSKKIHTLEGVPSKVLELKNMLSANTQLTLIWKPPYNPNGKILRYEVILKVNEYYGCRDLKIPRPDNHIITRFTTNTIITILDLRPYTSYSAQVIAHNSRHFSLFAETNFSTPQSEIPSEVFSQLRVENWRLLWNPPENCTTISGPLRARLIIQGISDAVKYFNVTKQTSDCHLNLDQLNPKLNGFERYLVTLYVIRDYSSKENTTAYQNYEFETPPTAPPKVTNLEIVEIDTRHKPAMIHLRWQSPLPPLNGKLRNYGVQFCHIHCSNRAGYYPSLSKIKKVQLNKSCRLWDDYICKVVKNINLSVPEITPIIQVSAYNINVTEPGLSSFVTYDRSKLHDRTPDAPGNYTFTINNNSVIDLKWFHPWKTGGHLKSFRIRIQETSSNLRRRISRSLKNEIIEFPVTQYRRNYSERLYLFPSTEYAIYIQAVTITNRSSSPKPVVIPTPSTAFFDGVLDVTVDKSDSTILLNIPSVLNDTQDSRMHILVKGPNLCMQHLEVPESLRAKAGLKNEFVWQATEVSTKELAGGQFRIGDNKNYSNAINCPLKSDFYEIIIIVTEQNSTKSIRLSKSIRVDNASPMLYEAWIIPITAITSFFVVTGIAFYLYQRKRQWNKNQFRNEIALQKSVICKHETKSTISNGIELMEDLEDLHIYESISSLRANTTEALVTATTNDKKEEEAEIISLIKVKDFEEYVRQAIQSGLLDKQYKTFSKGLSQPGNCGKLPLNKCKNRHENLIAYDKTRVMKKHPDDAYTDYINANYITGYKKKKHYIATQGPEPNTITDFWRMIWQENVLIICMLTNVTENGKCKQYWPDIYEKKKYGDIIVLNEKQNIFANYSFRTFQVTYGEKTRKIEHLHYTAWPDYEVPLHTHSVVTYLKKLLALSPGDGPVVVHCTDGVGRTGIIILCDICLHRAAAEGVVDVFAETASIRSERANIVDNKQQYLFAHLVLVECLFSVPTTLPCNEILITQIKELKKQSPAHQQRLQDTAWQDQIQRQDKVSRVYLKKYPTSDEDSDYLSAVYVDGVKLQNQYLATQHPTSSTINNFWRMVAEFKVELILMIQSPDFQDPTCCEIAPASGEFKPTPYLNITAKEAVKEKYYTSQKLLLIDNFEKPPREQYVTILHLTEWKTGKNQSLPPISAIVTFWQATENITRSNGPTVTLCHDGVTGCGLYLALSFLLERMAVEKECDVYLAVRAVKQSRTDFVRSLEHLEYLYDAAVTYMEFFKGYANFL